MPKTDGALIIAEKVATLWERHSSEIENKRQVAEERWETIVSGRESFWLWDAIVQSFSTNGGARHWENVRFLKSAFASRSDKDPFSWLAVLAYDDEELCDWLSVAANPHYQRWEGIRDRLVAFVVTYKKQGALQNIQDALARGNRNECIAVLKKVEGISDKYARNLLMDVGHPEFMDHSLALDSRIGTFLQKLTGMTHTYSKNSARKWTERELVAVAHDVGLTAWQLDRLVFEFGR